jgi:alkylation response protein AidB-like acyl-CoA dehydrogenase
MQDGDQVTEAAAPAGRAELLALAGRLADEFAQRAAEHDRDNTFPFESFQRMRETRYLALTIPQQLGGLGANVLDFALCQERLARGDGATALAVNMHLFGIGAMLEAGVPEDPMLQMFFRNVASGGLLLGGSLTEPESGGNWGFPVTRADPVPGGYRLNSTSAASRSLPGSAPASPSCTPASRRLRATSRWSSQSSAVPRCWSAALPTCPAFSSRSPTWTCC